ncbi:hypothetical protein CHS0354_000367 [Potamilus streckersoni]|uniref:DNA-directed RNA polymerase III subunit RPC4 n=1 Tax=Potamilus streckersoni TaxID=2493646 RepID=A0AAE0TIW5_9BIVA|nr:hypothetical protein CHS0354_000367 [Potamilus streckersoni]
MASGEDKVSSQLPRGLIGRKGVPTVKGTRLPSLRGPRDLTLGGIPKKVFTPNIPARREKSKESPLEEQINKDNEKSRHKEERRGFNHVGERGRGRGRGHGRGANLIQSHSIFEQGPGVSLLPKGNSNAPYEPFERGSSGRSSGSRPTVFKKEKTDTESKQVLDELLKDDFIDFGSAHSEDAALQPVQLPLAAVKYEAEFTKVKIKVETDMEVDPGKVAVKEEKDVAVDRHRTPITHIKSPTCADLFTKAQKTDVGELLFIQLPDVMPGVPAAQGDEGEAGGRPHKSADKSKQEDEEEIRKKLSTCSLAGFSEGPVGKLVIRKSGRTQLILGNTVLDVSMGTPCGFLQDLASVRVHEASGEMIVLGHIKHRLLCVPDFENLLQMT